MIRCKDCKHYSRELDWLEPYGRCERIVEDILADPGDVAMLSEFPGTTTMLKVLPGFGCVLGAPL